MNASKERKFVWWSHGANATRSTAYFFRKCFPDFWNYEDNHLTRWERPTHSFLIPEGCEDFVITTNVRNPYTLIVSQYRDLVDQAVTEGKNILDFKDWVFTESIDTLDLCDTTRWNLTGSVPEHFIHMESLEDDLVKLPFVQTWLKEDSTNYVILEEALDATIRKNVFKGESMADRYVNGFQDISGIYDQDTANQVVRLFSGEHYFNKIGYDIDSWKS